jgi:predicted acetyltransferase
MAIFQTASSIEVEVIPATKEQEPILANLLELYSHDFSQFIDLNLGPDGRFGYKYLPLYWKEPDRYPFLVMVNGHLAGFAFVLKGSEISNDADVWDMAEFFIVRGYRRLGVGKKAAHEVLNRFPGQWEVRVMDRNQKAVKFWRRAISEFTGKEVDSVSIEKNSKSWQLFSFESKSME